MIVLHVWPLRTNSLSPLTLRRIFDRNLLVFHLLEKLKNGRYDVISAMATVKNLG